MGLQDSFNNHVEPSNTIILRASELPKFRECPRNWYFQNVMRLEPLRKDRKLRFGACLHEALEQYYKTYEIEQAKGVFIRETDKELEKLMENLGPEIYEAEKDNIQEDIDLGEGLLDLYPEKAEELDPPDSELQIIETEYRFLVPIGEYADNTVYLAGKLDAIARDSYGGVWGIEHKTMSKSSDVENPENLVLDLQTTIQIMLLSIYFHNAMGGAQNVMGDLYNLIRKQKPGDRVKKKIYGRHRIKRTMTELQILHNLILNEDIPRIEQIKSKPVERVPYNPQIFGRCAWGCSYRDLCESVIRGEDTEYQVKTNYRVKQKSIYETLQDELAGQEPLWEKWEKEG